MNARNWIARMCPFATGEASAVRDVFEHAMPDELGRRVTKFLERDTWRPEN